MKNMLTLNLSFGNFLLALIVILLWGCREAKEECPNEDLIPEQNQTVFTYPAQNSTIKCMFIQTHDHFMTFEGAGSSQFWIASSSITDSSEECFMIDSVLFNEGKMNLDPLLCYGKGSMPPAGNYPVNTPRNW